MKLKRLFIAAGLILTSAVLPVQAANLMQTYYQALKSDPTFKQANANWESAKENLPIARAAYLTQVAITGNAQRQFNNTTPNLAIPPTNGYNYDYGFVLSVTQPIFNLSAWDAIKSAAAGVKSATATYSDAGQSLMVRTVKAYVAVLQAYDQLRFQLASKRAVLEQLKVARQQFKVGLIAITGVYDARSVYDQAVAQSIADQNTLNDAVESLAEITGVHYLRVVGISRRVPLVKPRPNDINAWADVAERQNYSLIAQNYSVIAARETIKQQSTSWLPQLSVGGQYTDDDQTSLQHRIPRFSTSNVVYGVTLNFPLIQGGAVTANTRQAQYNFLASSSQREFTYRSVISNTRQSFLGIITGISKIKADWQSVISAQNALNATKAGYEVGTRTMVDVLDDVTSLYQAQQQYTDDQYTYINNTIELKYYAGTLSIIDLKTINGWLKQHIKLNLPAAALKSLKSRLNPIKSAPPVPYAKNKVYKKVAKVRGQKIQSMIGQVALKKRLVKQKAWPTAVAKTKTAAIESTARATPAARQVTLPAPAQTEELPMPKQMVSFVLPAKKIAPATTSHVVPTRKKKVFHKTVSLDEQVLPLYESPSAKNRKL